MQLQLDDDEKSYDSTSTTLGGSNGTGATWDTDFQAEETPFVSRSTYIAPTEHKKFELPGFVVPLVLLAIVGILASVFIPKITAKKSLTTVVNGSKEDIASEAGITLTENGAYVKALGIPNGNTEGFQTYMSNNNKVCSVYYKGRPYGLAVSDSKYTMFGIKIGDSESHLIMNAEESNTLAADSGEGYKYSSYFEMIETGVTYSTDYYFIGTDGSVLILKCNNSSNRVVNITYYNNKYPILNDVDTF